MVLSLPRCSGATKTTRLATEDVARVEAMLRLAQSGRNNLLALTELERGSWHRGSWADSLKEAFQARGRAVTLRDAAT